MINWATKGLGAKLIDYSSELSGCKASNVLEDNLTDIWLTEEGLSQWFCVSLLSLVEKTIVIRTVGWHCWHPYSTNPQEVILHVSTDGSKFKVWDTLKANEQTRGTQLFCCAPISVNLYPFIAFEVHSTYGGTQTYMNRVFLYSDEITATPGRKHRPILETSFDSAVSILKKMSKSEESEERETRAKSLQGDTSQLSIFSSDTMTLAKKLERALGFGESESSGELETDSLSRRSEHAQPVPSTTEAAAPKTKSASDSSSVVQSASQEIFQLKFPDMTEQSIDDSLGSQPTPETPERSEGPLAAAQSFSPLNKSDESSLPLLLRGEMLASRLVALETTMLALHQQVSEANEQTTRPPGDLRETGSSATEDSWSVPGSEKVSSETSNSVAAIEGLSSVEDLPVDWAEELDGETAAELHDTVNQLEPASIPIVRPPPPPPPITPRLKTFNTVLNVDVPKGVYHPDVGGKESVCTFTSIQTIKGSSAEDFDVVTADKKSAVEEDVTAAVDQRLQQLEDKFTRFLNVLESRINTASPFSPPLSERPQQLRDIDSVAFGGTEEKKSAGATGEDDSLHSPLTHASATTPRGVIPALSSSNSSTVHRRGVALNVLNGSLAETELTEATTSRFGPHSQSSAHTPLSFTSHFSAQSSDNENRNPPPVEGGAGLSTSGFASVAGTTMYLSPPETPSAVHEGPVSLVDLMMRNDLSNESSSILLERLNPGHQALLESDCLQLEHAQPSSMETVVRPVVYVDMETAARVGAVTASLAERMRELERRLHYEGEAFVNNLVSSPVDPLDTRITTRTSPTSQVLSTNLVKQIASDLDILEFEGDYQQDFSFSVTTDSRSLAEVMSGMEMTIERLKTGLPPPHSAEQAKAPEDGVEGKIEDYTPAFEAATQTTLVLSQSTSLEGTSVRRGEGALKRDVEKEAGSAEIYKREKESSSFSGDENIAKDKRRVKTKVLNPTTAEPRCNIPAKIKHRNSSKSRKRELSSKTQKSESIEEQKDSFKGLESSAKSKPSHVNKRVSPEKRRPPTHSKYSHESSEYQEMLILREKEKADLRRSVLRNKEDKVPLRTQGRVSSSENRYLEEITSTEGKRGELRNFSSCAPVFPNDGRNGRRGSQGDLLDELVERTITRLLERNYRLKLRPKREKQTTATQQSLPTDARRYKPATNGREIGVNTEELFSHPSNSQPYIAELKTSPHDISAATRGVHDAGDGRGPHGCILPSTDPAAEHWLRSYLQERLHIKQKQQLLLERQQYHLRQQTQQLVDEVPAVSAAGGDFADSLQSMSSDLLTEVEEAMDQLAAAMHDSLLVSNWRRDKQLLGQRECLTGSR